MWVARNGEWVWESDDYADSSQSVNYQSSDGRSIMDESEETRASFESVYGSPQAAARGWAEERSGMPRSEPQAPREAPIFGPDARSPYSPPKQEETGPSYAPSSEEYREPSAPISTAPPAPVAPSPTTPVLASDGQSLSDQSWQTQSDFYALYKEEAANRWKDQHEQEIRRGAPSASATVTAPISAAPASTSAAPAAAPTAATTPPIINPATARTTGAPTAAAPAAPGVKVGQVLQPTAQSANPNIDAFLRNPAESAEEKHQVTQALLAARAKGGPAEEARVRMQYEQFYATRASLGLNKASPGTPAASTPGAPAAAAVTPSALPGVSELTPQERKTLAQKIHAGDPVGLKIMATEAWRRQANQPTGTPPADYIGSWIGAWQAGDKNIPLAAEWDQELAQQGITTRRAAAPAPGAPPVATRPAPSAPAPQVKPTTPAPTAPAPTNPVTPMIPSSPPIVPAPPSTSPDAFATDPAHINPIPPTEQRRTSIRTSPGVGVTGDEMAARSRAYLPAYDAQMQEAQAAGNLDGYNKSRQGKLKLQEAIAHYSQFGQQTVGQFVNQLPEDLEILEITDKIARDAAAQSGGVPASPLAASPAQPTAPTSSGPISIDPSQAIDAAVSNPRPTFRDMQVVMQAQRDSLPVGSVERAQYDRILGVMAESPDQDFYQSLRNGNFWKPDAYNAIQSVMRTRQAAPMSSNSVQTANTITLMSSTGSAWREDLSPDQWKAYETGELPYDVAMAACGPGAIMTVLRASGRNPNWQETVDLAAQYGWTQEAGMSGMRRQQDMLQNEFGIRSAFRETLNFAEVDAAIARGGIVLTNTNGGNVPLSAGHYFALYGKDEQGRYLVGGSGTGLKNGSAWMTPEQMMALGGSFRHGLYINAEDMGRSIATMQNGVPMPTNPNEPLDPNQPRESTPYVPADPGQLNRRPAPSLAPGQTHPWNLEKPNYPGGQNRPEYGTPNDWVLNEGETHPWNQQRRPPGPDQNNPWGQYSYRPEARTFKEMVATPAEFAPPEPANRYAQYGGKDLKYREPTTFKELVQPEIVRGPDRSRPGGNDIQLLSSGGLPPLEFGGQKWDKSAAYYAVMAEQQSGGRIPAEVILAVATNEGGRDGSQLTRDHYNFFGMKADPSWTARNRRTVDMMTGEDYGGSSWSTENASWRSYDDPVEGFLGLQDFLERNPRYGEAGVWEAQSPEDFVQRMKNGKYATDRNWVPQLHAIMQDQRPHIEAARQQLYGRR